MLKNQSFATISNYIKRKDTKRDILFDPAFFFHFRRKKAYSLMSVMETEELVLDSTYNQETG